MKNKYTLSIIYYFSLVVIAFLTGCKSTVSENISAKEGLKEYYQAYFPVGVAVSPRSLRDSSQSELIKNEFISMTAENAMKPGPIHPQEDQYNWEPADEILAFAEANNMMLRGHTLCWHSQSPDWFFVDEDGKQVSKEVLLQRLEDHIAAVAGRYKGNIYAWDVVNEAISDSDDEFYRNSPWYQICGEEYIIKAFQFAKKYAPEAVLFYNDYNVIDSAKRQKIITMIQDLKSKGAPIEGIGIQGHWSIYEPSEAQLRATIEEFQPLDLEIQITELDLSVYEKEHSRREPKETDTDVFTPQLEQLQTEKYKMIFEVFRDYKDDISNVTFWNISDRHSWLDNFPVRGRKDYPLLFDQEDKPKKAYEAVIDF
jgi:endo-1,4-beta-xylanase